MSRARARSYNTVPLEPYPHLEARYRDPGPAPTIPCHWNRICISRRDSICLATVDYRANILVGIGDTLPKSKEVSAHDLTHGLVRVGSIQKLHGNGAKFSRVVEALTVV